MKKNDIADVLKQLDEIPLPDKEKVLSFCLQQADSGGRALPAKRGRRPGLRPLVAVCTILVLLIAGFSTYAIAADIREYNEAVTFFLENDLPMEGLSRGEIKRVFRDIKTGTFTYDKTAEVIEKSIIEGSIGGYEIFQEDPTPQDLRNLWNYKNIHGYYMRRDSIKHKDGVSYRYLSREKYDEDLGFHVHDVSILEKYINDKPVWNVEFSSFWIEGYVPFDEKVIVYGQSPTTPDIQKSYAWMALVDSNGTILWQKRLENGFKSEYIGAIVPSDEKIVVFSRGDLRYFCLNEYDIQGNVVKFHKTEVGNYGIWNAAKLGDGYIVQLGNFIAGEYARIVKVSRDGEIVDSFLYESDDIHYYITDMLEYNGLIYLSAYSVPVTEDEENQGSRQDIAAILKYIFDGRLDISNEELTDLVREHFTAVLLVCSPESGRPQEFYSVKGSLGGRLALDDSKKLTWDVESITDTFFSPATSAFTIGGASYVYRYTFDQDGRLLERVKTDEVVDFYR